MYIFGFTSITGANNTKNMEVHDFENLNLTDIITPVDVGVLKRLLQESGYDTEKTKFLIDGFTNGFSLQYKGKLENMYCMCHSNIYFQTVTSIKI